MRAEEGLSVREISLQVGAAKSTCSVWVRDIELSDEQKRERDRRAGEALALGATRRSQYWADKRVAYREEGRSLAQRGDWLHVAGCMLYWGEGTKHRYRASLANSDPELLSLYIRFLRECYGVSDDRMRLQVQVYEDLNIKEVEDFWLATLELPRAALTKTISLRSRASSQRYATLRPLPYGTCRLTALRSVALVQSIYGALLEYIDTPQLNFPM